MTLGVGVVGCGLIGQRRARVVHSSPGTELRVVADIDLGRAAALAIELGCQVTLDWREVVTRDDVQVVVVSTVNKVLMPVAIAALERGKHVLCEKPLGRNSGEAQRMVEAAGRTGALLKTGFNHRHHPAIWQAHGLCEGGAIGPLLFVRAVYGHGGRAGYDREWRADPDLAGGGELLDQGVHIVDLCRWFLGELTEAVAFTSTLIWDLGYWGAIRSDKPIPTDPRPSAGRCQLEDNAFALLRTADGRTAQFHTSWTQWKNRFTFEACGRDGYMRIEGLGGSYGTETLTVGARRPESGTPVEERFEFPGPDLSWQAEWQEFTSAIAGDRQPLANGEDGLQAMRLIAALYESSRTGRVVRL